VDLKAYFHKVKTIEAALSGEYVVVTSRETAEGEQGGYFVEVTRAIAAKLIAQGKMRQATEAEAEAFHSSARAAKRTADEQARARLRLNLMAGSNWQPLDGAFPKGE
jgi:hypothetical protein